MYPCARRIVRNRPPTLPRRQSAVGCDFRAVQALCRPLPLCPVPWPGKQPSLVCEPAVSGLGTSRPWSGKHPSCGPPLLVVLRSSLRGGPRDPMFSLVVRAAAANVNPRTRLNHMTSFIVCDWCTRERCRPMMQNPQIFPEFPADNSQDLRRAREFPRIFPGFSDKVRRRPGLEHTTPARSPTPPLKPAACYTEASCVTH